MFLFGVATLTVLRSLKKKHFYSTRHKVVLSKLNIIHCSIDLVKTFLRSPQISFCLLGSSSAWLQNELNVETRQSKLYKFFCWPGMKGVEDIPDIWSTYHKYGQHVNIVL